MFIWSELVLPKNLNAKDLFIASWRISPVGIHQLSMLDWAHWCTLFQLDPIGKPHSVDSGSGISYLVCYVCCQSCVHGWTPLLRSWRCRATCRKELNWYKRDVGWATDMTIADKDFICRMYKKDHFEGTDLFWKLPYVPCETTTACRM